MFETLARHKFIIHNLKTNKMKSIYLFHYCTVQGNFNTVNIESNNQFQATLIFNQNYKSDCSRIVLIKSVYC